MTCKTTIFRGLGILAACLSLAACGDPSTETPGAASVTQAPEYQMTGLLADTRAYYYLPPLTRNPRLDAAARAHGADMARNNFFGHASTNGDHVTQRVAKAGYSACLAAENLGWGKVHADPQTMMTGWLNSPGHRSNLLHPRATEFGLARAADTDGSHDPLWVLVIGRPGC